LTFKCGLVLSLHNDYEAKQLDQLIHQEFFSFLSVKYASLLSVSGCLWEAVNDIVLLEFRVMDCENMSFSTVLLLLYREFSYYEVVPSLITNKKSINKSRREIILAMSPDQVWHVRVEKRAEFNLVISNMYRDVRFERE